MRRIDVLGIGIGVFFAGGLVYGLLRAVGVEPLQAGIWSQAIFCLGGFWVGSRRTCCGSLQDG